MIPNDLHFIYVGGKPFSLIHYLAIKSACIVNSPRQATLHYSQEPAGDWWDKTRPYVQAVQVVVPSTIAGIPVQALEHAVDLMRLYILQEYGGIYLDIDVICIQPFTPLLNYPCVLGEQGVDGKKGLCNAVILAEKGAFFLQKWIEGFDSATSFWSGFRAQGHDEHWDEMSVKYPMYLAQMFPEQLCIQNYKKFYWPCYYPSHLELLFTQQGYSFPEAYCIHLWESRSWHRYLHAITINDLRKNDTNFAHIVSRFL